MGRSLKLPPLSSQVSESRYCFLSTSIAWTKGLRLLMAGRETCREEYLLKRSGYPSMALELVVAGSGAIEIGDVKRPLLPGMIFTYGPDTPHSIRAGTGEKLIKYFVDFVGTEGADLLRSAGMNPGKMAVLRNPEPMIGVFELLLNRGGNLSKINTELCTDYLRAILRMSSEKVPVRSKGLMRNDCYNNASALIDADYAIIKTIEEVARRVGVTPEHLSRVFREMGEDPPSKRLTLKKLTHAAGLLLSGGWKVKEVAYKLGYATPFHFSSVFKRHFGYSPRSLRMQTRGSSRQGHAHPRTTPR